MSDEREIERLVDVYFSSVDSKNAETYRTIWADDTTFTMFATPDGTGGITHRGIDAATDTIKGTSGFESSVHAKGNFVVMIDGDTATANTFAVAYVSMDQQVLVRGIRYRDELVRTADGWKIQKRVHAPLWQFNTASVPLVIPGLNSE